MKQITHVCLACVFGLVGLTSCAQDAGTTSLADKRASISPQNANAFPRIYNSEPEKEGFISPEAALASLRLPDDFRATLFAAEPQVQNPIAGCTDARGRVWIAENYTYAERALHFDLSLNDRVIVLEDADNDGHAEKRTVFVDDIKMLTGITVGRGGVWLMCPPQLLFIPDADGDLVPDGPPQVKLDGFRVGQENYHNFANGLSFGPDGWLYGRCGASAPGEMGLPGSTDEERIPIRGGIWRYHPTMKLVEALTQGTTNPWGSDWNELGDQFFINTVNGHFWHAIPGAHFVRPHTIDVNPHAYELIDMHADHWHFDTGKSWTASRDGAANDYGGGHAHIGMVLYQEDTWPKRFRNRVLTVNMHGRRVNQEILQRTGSGYVAKHGEDFLLSDDVWFRGMELLPLPDGNVLVLDWSDTGECHDSTGVHRTSGRIFKIIYKNRKGQPNGLSEETLRDPSMLVESMRESTWRSRKALEGLFELGDRGVQMEEAAAKARELLYPKFTQRSEAAQRFDWRVFDHKPEGSALDELRAGVGGELALRLRGLWALNAMGQLREKELEWLLYDADEAMRCWAIRLISQTWPIDTAVGRRPVGAAYSAADEMKFGRLLAAAVREKSVKVRLEFASLMQRLPSSWRPAFAAAIAVDARDSSDHNLPLMVYYGLIPTAESHPTELVEALAVCKLDDTIRLATRRLADSSNAKSLDSLLAVATSSGESFGKNVLLGMSEAFSGRRSVEPPTSWQAFKESLSQSTNKAVAQAIQNLDVLFGDGRTIEELKKLAADSDAGLEVRKAALESLVDADAVGVDELCKKLLRIRFLNSIAARGLARSADPSVAEALIKEFRRFHPSERPQVIGILVSRSSWAVRLLEAVAAGNLSIEYLNPYHARQIASLSDPEATALLEKVWGQVRTTPAERVAKIDRLKNDLTAEVLAGADLSQGRALFAKNCAACHTLYGAGGKLGPDLTGAQRTNLDYVLENVVDPSAVVTKEFRASRVLTEDDRVLTGLLQAKTDAVVTLATQDKTFRIPAEEVVSIKLSPNSTMPEGLLDQLSRQQIIDLIGYLQSREQVPLPE